jgi:16S rRNA C1402 (ribose-2'-O) methylase RsmI
LNYFQQPKGEFTLVIEGSTKQADTVSDEAMIEKLRVLKSQEISARDAAVQLNSLLGVPKNRVYRLWLRLD